MAVYSLGLYIATLMLILNYHTVNSCGCPLKLHQEKFCEADFVIKARVNNIIPIYATDRVMNYGETVVTKKLMRYNYRIRLQKTYKKNSSFKRAKQRFVFSPGPDAPCGQVLRKNQVYLLTGKVINRELWIDACGWNVPYKGIDPGVKRKIWRIYKKHCRCEIQKCYGKDCKQPEKKNQCVMQLSAWSCFLRYGLCVVDYKYKKPDGPQCKWYFNPKKLPKCLNNIGMSVIQRNG